MANLPTSIRGFKTKSVGLMVRLPSEVDPTTVKRTCCAKLPVFAEQTTKTDSFKNDFKLLPVQKRQTFNDTFTFKLLHCGGETILNDNSLGEFVDFDTLEKYPNYTYFILDWFKVLNTLGAGNYQYKIEYNISGIEGEKTSAVYNLQPFSFDRADGTVRIVGQMGGYLEQFDVDYNGLNLRDCARINGVFGEQQPEIEKTTFIHKNREKNTIKISEIREFKLETSLLESEISEHLQDWLFKADFLLISDFNLYNHINYKEFEVTSPKSLEYEYFAGQKGVVLKASFEDYKDNRRKLKCT